MQVAATGTLVMATGCAGTRMPDWYHPGPAGYQRYNALQYDPYPSDDLGPPVAGARPREYSREIPEPERIQKFAPPPAGVKPLVWPSFSLPSMVSPAPTAAASGAPVTPVFSSPPVRPPY